MTQYKTRGSDATLNRVWYTDEDAYETAKLDIECSVVSSTKTSSVTLVKNTLPHSAMLSEVN